MSLEPDSPVKQTPGRILVVDDEEIPLKRLRRILEKQGHLVSTYSAPLRALDRLMEQPYDILLTDLRMPHMDGLELLDQAKLIYPDLEVIILTGFASLEGAVKATKKGAYHFLPKPFTPGDVIRVVDEALGQKRLREAAQKEEAGTVAPGREPFMVGKSPQMVRVAQTIAQIAVTDCNVLIVGQSGTGKELAARAIHAQSLRASGPRVAFSCAALSPELIDNELFGHEKDAFTGASRTQAGLLEAASGGTLFLDEIGEMPPNMQVKLLRALQEREILRVGGTRPVPVDIRVVAAASRDLRTEVEHGGFRRDLFYRLNVVTLELPRLAERKGDIALLAHYFLDLFNARMGKDIKGFTQEAMDLITAYAYPGNVRELMNIMERAVALCRESLIQARDLPPDLAQVEVSVFPKADEHTPTLEEMERQYIEHILNLTGGMRSRAASILGIDRVSLWRKMKKFNLK